MKHEVEMEYQGPIGPATEEMDANVQLEVFEVNPPPAIYIADEAGEAGEAAAVAVVADEAAVVDEAAFLAAVVAAALADDWVDILPDDFDIDEEAEADYHRAKQAQWEEDKRVVQVLMSKIPRTSDLSVIRQLLKVIEKEGQLTGFEESLVRRFGSRWFCINPTIAELMLAQSKQESDPKAVQQMSSFGVSNVLSCQEIMNSVLIHFPEDGSPAQIYQNFSQKDEFDTTRIYSQYDLFNREKNPRELRFELFKRHTLIFETPDEAKRMFSERGNWNRVLLKNVVFVETKAQFQAHDTHRYMGFGFQSGARHMCHTYTREEKVQVGRLPPINVRRTFCTAEAMIDSIYYIRDTGNLPLHEFTITDFDEINPVVSLNITEVELEDRALTVDEMEKNPESLFGTKGMI